MSVNYKNLEDGRLLGCTACSLIEIYRRFRDAYCLHQQRNDPDVGGSKHLRNVGKFLPDYTLIDLLTEAVCIPETSANLYQTTQRNILTPRELEISHITNLTVDRIIWVHDRSRDLRPGYLLQHLAL
jgi:hypothetical protein